MNDETVGVAGIVAGTMIIALIVVMLLVAAMNYEAAQHQEQYTQSCIALTELSVEKCKALWELAK